MKTSKIDFYKGYEGEPEIVIDLVNQGDVIESISIWEGYFNLILDEVNPDADGWNGLAYYYQMHSGWYEHSPWKLEHIDEIIEQLTRIDNTKLGDIPGDVLLSLIILLTKALGSEDTIHISYM